MTNKIKSILANFFLTFFCLSIFGLLNINTVYASGDEESTDPATNVHSVLADQPDNVPEIHGGNATDKVSFIIFKIVDFMLIATGALAVLFIAISGMRFVLATGNQDMIDGAKRNLQYAVIGLFVVILSWAIVNNVVKILFTKDNSTSSDCREIGCICLINSDCDSGNCSSLKCKE